MDSFLTTTTTSSDQRKQSPTAVSRKPLKQKKNKPIKVRYISNPMKVKTCASKFRELVQELTGQDAVDLQPEEPTYFPSDDHSLSPPPCTTSPEENLAPRVLLHQEPFDDVVADDYYEPLDGEEMFLPDQMSAGFSGYFSNGFYNVKEFETIDSM